MSIDSNDDSDRVSIPNKSSWGTHAYNSPDGFHNPDMAFGMAVAQATPQDINADQAEIS